MNQDECPICGSQGVLLGCLGTRAWYRCECCGMEFHGEMPEELGYDDEEQED